MPVSENILFEDQYAKAWIHDGILCFEYKDKAVVDLEIQKKHIEVRMAITGKDSLPLFCDAHRGTYWTSEARNYSIRHCEGITATAMLVEQSLVQKTVLNFFLRFLKIPVPFKVFTSESEAFQWLQQYKV